MKFLPLLIIATTFFMASCSTKMHKSQKAGSLEVNVKSNLHADLDVDMSRKIVGTASHSRLFGLFYIKTSQNFADGVSYDGDQSGWFSSGIVSSAKSAAAYNAVVPSKADVIVAPQYLIKVKSYFFGAYKEVTAQVSGYAGTIRSITPSKR